ncbi:MAG: cytochrome C, partial [Burkholderiales bacterium]
MHKNKSLVLFLFAAWLWLCLPHTAWAEDNIAHSQLIEQGKRIYREGVLSDGSLLRASQGSLSLSGAEAACVRCHRRSGFGGSEGRRFARPLIGKYLFTEPDHNSIASRVPQALQNRRHAAYTTPTLLRALGEGIDSTDRPLDPLMPRYKFSAQDVEALNAYFVSLSANLSPGVDDKTAHFATIVTDDVPPEKSRLMLEMLNIFVADKNAGTRLEDGRKRVGREYIDRAYRKWELHVWQLSGAPETWLKQLQDYYRQQPVFAVISGISTQNWAPIHAFCEQAEIPCVYP